MHETIRSVAPRCPETGIAAAAATTVRFIIILQRKLAALPARLVIQCDLRSVPQQALKQASRSTAVVSGFELLAKRIMRTAVIILALTRTVRRSLLAPPVHSGCHATHFLILRRIKVWWVGECRQWSTSSGQSCWQWSCVQVIVSVCPRHSPFDMYNLKTIKHHEGGV